MSSKLLHERYTICPTGCWIWNANPDSDGYAILVIKGKSYRAHRYLYKQKHGSIPEGMQLDHLCRIRNCVNPDHLEPVSCKENIRRSSLTDLTRDVVQAIKQAHLNGLTYRQIASKFNMHYKTIWQIATKKRWVD